MSSLGPAIEPTPFIVEHCVSSRDGKWLFCSYGSKLSKVSLVTLRKEGETRVEGVISALAFCDRENSVLAVLGGCHLAKISGESLRLLRSLGCSAGETLSIFVLPGTTKLLCSGIDALKIRNSSTLECLATLRAREFYPAAVCCKNRTVFLENCEENRIEVLDFDQLFPRNFAPFSGKLIYAGITSSGLLLAISTEFLELYDVDLHRVIRKLELSQKVVGSLFVSGTSGFARLTSAELLLAFSRFSANFSTPEALTSPPTFLEPFHSLSELSDSKFAALDSFDRLFVVKASKNNRFKMQPLPPKYRPLFRFSPFGKQQAFKALKKTSSSLAQQSSPASSSSPATSEKNLQDFSKDMSQVSVDTPEDETEVARA